ncbi:hypothetical protein ARMA_2548 [Ardenticatena maritima]|nr:hypothetical protein ARMA_2548 [Ardenticatena maritima]
MTPLHSAGTLSVEIIAAPNLVVDSNVLTPATYAPKVATVIGKFCNTGTTPITSATAYIGDYTGSGSLLGTPGVYPSKTNPTVGGLTYSGTYVFIHLGGSADAARSLGTLNPGQCKYQYWSFEYPHLAVNDADGSTIPTWGTSVKPDDDLSLDFDMWAIGSDGVSTLSANATHTATMRNEISAMANKIKPNGNPPGKWFNTDTSTVYPGQIITTNGVLYRLGNVNQGFDNNNDGVPDYNAWLQPFGDPSYDPSCFRLIGARGVLTVTRSGGNPDLIIPFEHTLYFTDLPSDNTDVRGEVYYTFQALRGPCVVPISPYQEVASGSDNEKFNGDYGTGVPFPMSYAPTVTLSKSAPGTQAENTTFTYSIPFENTSSTTQAGLVLSSGEYTGTLMISDTVPIGLTYVGGSAAANNTIPAGNSVTIRYSTDGGQTWSNTDPGNATSTSTNPVVIQWWLDAPLDVQGSGKNSGTVTFQATIPSGYIAGGGDPFVENCTTGHFGDAPSFAQACATTLVEGTNSIGDFVWQDDDGDGIQDTGESGISGVQVSLYWDRNGDGTLDSNDVLISTQDTDANGNYDFANLPDGNYLVQVNTTDADLPTGYGPTTTTTWPVSVSGSQDYNDADFGFGPILQIAKTLNTFDPAYNGELITFTISLNNLLPGDGTSNGACQYPVWATIAIPDSSGTPPGGNSANAQWINPNNALTPPDGEYASTNLSDNADLLGLSGFNTAGKLGNITSVKVMAYVKELKDLQSGDTFEIRVYRNDSTYETFTFDGTTDFTGPAGTIYTFESTVTPPAGGWTWADFQNNVTEAQLYANKGTGNVNGDIGVDAIAFVITTDQTCGGADSTIVTLPLTDTYDADILEFVRANPAPASATTSGTPPNSVGTLTWENLGPLYAGGRRNVQVVFRALDTASPTPTTNTATVTNAYLANGKRANDDSDTATVEIKTSGSIAGTIWADTNGTTGWAGTTGYDGSDTFIPEATVQLYACTLPNGLLLHPADASTNKDCGQNGGTWKLVATTTTDSSGNYTFSGLRDGFYNVKVDTTTLPAGFTVTSAEADPAGNGAGSTCSTCDNQWNSDSANLGTFNSVDNSGGSDNITNVSFGYRNASNNGAVTGYVWNDRDGQGDWNAGEEPIAGVTVSLCSDSSCNTVTATTNTDANGFYSFGNVTPGTYYVRVDTTDLPGMSQSGDPDETGACTTCDSTTTSGFTVSANEVEGTYNFGYTGGLSIGDTVYADWDGDGTQESGEEGISGITVYLYRDWDGDGVIDSNDTLLATDTTDASGVYGFSNLPGNGAKYIVKVADGDIPSGYSQTGDPDEAGTCSTCDSQASVTLNTTNVDTADFGYQPQGFGSIGDTIWNDADADGTQDNDESGIQNVVVNLYQDQDGDGVIDPEDALVDTQTTDASGNYAFSNLPAGDFIVQVGSSNFNVGQPLANLTISGDPDSTKDSQHAVTLTAAQSYLDADFGYTSSSIGDFIWADYDGDGNPDPGEPGINGVVVELYADTDNDGNPDGAAIATTTTANNSSGAPGYYLFGGLGEGNYIVKVASSNFNAGGTLYGYTQTGDPDAPSQPCSGGDCDNTSLLEGYTAPDSTFFYGLQLGQNDLSHDFGYKPSGASIGDTLWIDTDGDNVRDAGEPGIADITIKLCSDASCTSVVATTSTDANGEYAFGGVADGTYYVQVDTSDPDWPGSLTQTYMPDGGNADNQADNVVVSGGNVTQIGTNSCSNCDLDVDFGYRFDGTNSLSGTVWHDTDSGGQTSGIGDIDADETVRYNGVPVYLWYCGADNTCGNSDDILVGSTTTASDGTYAFPNLADGTYRVVANANAYSLRGTSPTTTTDYDGNPATDPAVTFSGGGNSATRDFGFISTVDLGDLPSSYNLTKLAVDGARHTVGTLKLGSVADTDPDGQESPDATGDDNDGSNDDDGVTRTAGVKWSAGNNGGSVDITVSGCSGTCYVSAWIDWNHDGDFYDSGEQILTDQSVVNGTQTITFDIPSGTNIGATFNARFRLYERSTNGLARPTGLVTNGEVEDYQWQFAPTAITLTAFDGAVAHQRLTALVASALLTLMGMFVLWRRRH